VYRIRSGGRLNFVVSPGLISDQRWVRMTNVRPEMSCATALVVIRSKCKAQRWRTSSSCPNTRSFHSVSPIVCSPLLFFLLARRANDGIARPEQKEPIRLSRAGLDKLIGIKADKGAGAAPSDTPSELCRCIRPKNGPGRRLERVGATSRGRGPASGSEPRGP